MLKYQTDFDERTGQRVLTCFLLPQQGFHTDSMGTSHMSEYTWRVACLICHSKLGLSLKISSQLLLAFVIVSS